MHLSAVIIFSILWCSFLTVTVMTVLVMDLHPVASGFIIMVVTCIPLRAGGSLQ